MCCSSRGEGAPTFNPDNRVGTVSRAASREESREPPHCLRQVAAQQAPKPNPYPEHGQVIATRLGAEAVGSAGIVGSLKRWIYRVDCGDLYYDLQGGGKPSLTVGQNVTFRIEKQKAYLDDGKSGKRYNIVGTGKSDQKQSPQPD